MDTYTLPTYLEDGLNSMTTDQLQDLVQILQVEGGGHDLSSSTKELIINNISDIVLKRE